jgi:Fe-S-cluster-containing hydrogenase component 2
MVDTEELEHLTRPTLADQLFRLAAKNRGEEPRAEQRPRLKKVPVKCDLDKGHLFPACVNNCPTQAIRRYRADELDVIIAGQRNKKS